MAFAILAHRIDAIGDLTGGAKNSGTFNSTGADFLLVGMVCQVANNASILSDSKSNTWIEIHDASDNSGFGDLQWFYAKNALVSSSHTVTLSPPATFPPTTTSVVILACSGSLQTADPLDTNSYNTTNGANGPITPGSITPAANNEILISLCEWETAGGTVSVGSGFTITDQIDVGANNYGTALAYKIQTSLGAENPSWSSSVTQSQMEATLACFKAAPPAGFPTETVRVVDGPVSASMPGSTFYVATTGNDGNVGSIGSPWLTPAFGVSQLHAGDTLLIRVGTYTGTGAVIDSIQNTVRSGTSWANPITIAAYGGSTTANGTYGPSGSAEVVVLQPPINRSPVALSTNIGSGLNASYLILKDLILDGVNSGPGTGSTAEVVYMYLCDHVRLQQCEIKNNATFGVHLGFVTPFNEFLRNAIHNVGNSSSTAGNGHGLYITASDNLFDANSVYTCGGYGFHIYNNTGTHADPSRNVLRNNLVHATGLATANTCYGLAIVWGDSNQVYNNILYNNSGGGAQLYTFSTKTTFVNNTITGNSLEGLALQYYGAGVTVENNISFNNTIGQVVDYGDQNGQTGTFTSSNNLLTDPLFVNAGAQNYHLQVGSAAVNTGLTIPLVGSDFDGLSRPQGSFYCIGALELASINGAPPAATVRIADGPITATITSTSLNPVGLAQVYRIADTVTAVLGSLSANLDSMEGLHVVEIVAASLTVLLANVDSMEALRVTDTITPALAAVGSLSANLDSVEALHVADTLLTSPIGVLAVTLSEPCRLVEGVSAMPFGSFLASLSNQQVANTYLLTIGGTTIAPIAQSVTISQPANGASVLTCDIASLTGSYIPTLDVDAQLLLNGTPVYGGTITDVVTSGLGGDPAIPIVSRITITDYNGLADQRDVFDSFVAGPLKTILVRMAAYLAPFGVVIDPAQAAGPAMPAVVYDDRKLRDVLNELVTLAGGGWVWEIDPLKVFRMYPIGSLTAPFNVIDGDKNAVRDLSVQVSRTSANLAYANHVIVRGGTAQVPIRAEASNGPEQVAHKVWDVVVAAPTATTLVAAQALANELILQYVVSPKAIKYTTIRSGLKVGQTQTITRAARGINNTFLLTDLSTMVEGDSTLVYTVSAIEGSIYQGSWRDIYKQFSGGASQVTAAGTTTGGAGRTVWYLGGSSTMYVDSDTLAWVPIDGTLSDPGTQVPLDTVARGSATATVHIRLRARTGTVQARLRNISDGLTVGTSALVNTATFTQADFTVTLTAGNKIYQVELVGSIPSSDIAGIAFLE